MDINLK